MINGKEFEFDIAAKPTFSYIQIKMKKGQRVQCEGGTMAYFDPTLRIETH